MTVLDVMDDAQLFGGAFADDSWAVWHVFLAAAFRMLALGVTQKKERPTTVARSRAPVTVASV